MSRDRDDVPRWLRAWLSEHPELRGAVERWLAAARVVRELAAQAFVGPLEPSHPEFESLRAKLAELDRLAAFLAENPTRERGLAACQLLAELLAESFFLAPTRATSSPVARALLGQAVSLTREAWKNLQDAGDRHGVEIPWRLLLATHVPVEEPWERARMAGNALAGLPVASWPWGERCALTGRWWQEDGVEAIRFRNAEDAFFALSPEAWQVFSRLQEGWARLAATDAEAAAELASAFPALAAAFTPETACNTFASLGLASPPSLAACLNNALVRFGPRPLFANVWEGTWLSYGEVRRQALGLARAMLDAGLAPGERVGLAFASPGYRTYLVDFACVFAGLTTVGMDPFWPARQARAALAEAHVRTVVGDSDGLGHLQGLSGRRLCFGDHPPPGVEPLAPSPLPEGWTTPTGIGLATPVVFADNGEDARGLVPDPPGSLYTIVFTSGSTGTPKGIPITRERMRRQGFQAFLWPFVIPSFQPYALFADRRAVWQAVMCGGRVGFCRRGSELWEDLKTLAPTYLEGPPGLFLPLVGAYRAALAEGKSAAELAELRLALRGRLGGRVAAVAVGGAPVPPDLPGLLSAAFQAQVAEAYGTTEVGTIAQGNRLRPGVKVRLVDHPNLGFSSQDQPYPRGELAVKLTPEQAAALSLTIGRDRLTADGYLLTGDLVELRPSGDIRVLGRVGQLVKLADGRFVLPAEAEAACLAAGSVRQAALLVVEGRPLLVVVPEGEADAPTVEARVRRAWAQVLPGRPCPEILVDRQGTWWSAENGLATSSGKPNRAALARFYGDRAAGQRGQTQTPPSPEANVLEQLAKVLAKSPAELDLTKPLGEQGLDSLATAELLALADARGLSLAPEDLKTWPLAQLLEFFHRTPASPEKPRREDAEASPTVVSGGLEDELHGDVLRIPLPATRPPFAPTGLTILTGGTGFLGVHLLAQLANDPPAGGPVVALVRARDPQHARTRVAEALHRAQLPTVSIGTWGDEGVSVWAVPCDLAAPNLGLDPSLYARLAAEAAAIVHAAASVRHQASYAELRRDNVEPTRQLLRLAVTTRLKAFHLVSTLDVTRLAWAAGSSGQEEAPLPPRLGPLASQTGGYVLTKWVAERMVELLSQHLAGAWPVVVSRPGLISWSGTTGFANLEEWFPALVASCLQLGAVPSRAGAAFPSEPVLTETSARGLQPLPVDFVARVLARLTAALVVMASQGKAVSVRLNLVNTNPGTAGLVLWPQLFAALQAAHLAFGGKRPLTSVRWPDFRDLCLIHRTPFAPLVPSFPDLPALPRFSAETMQALLGTEKPPAWKWQLFLPFLRWLEHHEPSLSAKGSR